jgi:glycosyltransferase involved in cell wall biosynthesis
VAGAVQDPTISVVVPCRNEQAHIAQCLESLLPQLAPTVLEVLVVDGGSDDGTRAIVAGFSARDPRIRLVDNPRRHAAAALNIGIALAAGDLVVRADAHSVYPPDYLRRLTAALDVYDADNVGATFRIAPAGPTSKALAIARALAHPFGAGTARFRSDAGTARRVDTVPFGCFRRSTFDRLGLFHEELEANQDDEFNARLLNRGGTVVLVPDLHVTYVARGTIAELWRTYFRYGHYKPLALRLSGRPVTLRQFLPGGWLLTMIGALMWTAASSSLVPLVFTWGTYLSVASGIAVAEGWRARQATFAWWLLTGFVTMHLAYGAGWWTGVPRALRAA